MKRKNKKAGSVVDEVMAVDGAEVEALFMQMREGRRSNTGFRPVTHAFAEPSLRPRSVRSMCDVAEGCPVLCAISSCVVKVFHMHKRSNG